MKLQIKDAGSWRHILNFDKNVETAVRQRSVKLIAAVNNRITLRILDDQGAIRARAAAPDFTWEERPN
ncbi:MAG: hypothetical protein M3Y65_18995 [Pseudomonadota bacterium]|nr:hypothetical protein [Pseudomonadota bacterium]